MARGNKIVVTTPSRGLREEGYVADGQTPKPGTIMQRDPSVALKGGRHTYTPYNRDADGDRPAGALWILLEDSYQGKGPNDAYAAGDRCFLESLVPGQEYNAIVLNLAGTGDDHAVGELLSVDDGTGKLVASTGETEPFQLLEAITDPTADTLAWVQYSGY